MPKFKKYERGFTTSSLSLMAIGFLTLSLVAVTVVINNQNFFINLFSHAATKCSSSQVYCAGCGGFCLDDTSKVGCNVAQEQKCGQQAQYGSTVAQVVACPGKTQCTCNGSTVCFNTTGSCTASDGLCALVKSTGNSSSSNSSNTQTGSSSVSGCIGEGGTVANGSSPCCSGLVQANCVANGSFSYCICTNPNNVPAPSPTETCTVRNCSGTTCASTTTTVSSNQACPPSSCANDNDCKNSTTSSSTTTINSGSNNSSTAYCNVSTQNLGCGEAGCAKTEMAQITTKVDCTKVTTCTQNINCGAVFKAQCTSGKTQCNSSTNLQTCVNGMWTIGEYCVNMDVPIQPAISKQAK